MARGAIEEKQNGLQKAAVLLIALGPERSAGIFKHLKEEEWLWNRSCSRSFVLYWDVCWPSWHAHGLSMFWILRYTSRLMASRFPRL